MKPKHSPSRTGDIPENPMGKYVKHPERYKFVDGEWWYYYPENGTSISSGNHIRERAETLRKRFNKVMRVDGKYIPRSHPLHKPGSYKGFTDAAFSSLQNYERSKEGQVYILRNPAFPSWCKVGMAVDAQDRLKQYQTSSPYRDYEVVKAYSTNNRREAEAQAHSILEKHYERRGEWFVCDASLAEKYLDTILESKGEQFELF